MAFKAGSVFVDAELRDQKFKKGMAGLGKAAVAGGAIIGAALVAGFVTSTKAADEFQRSMSNVATVIDTSVISTQDMTKALLRMDPALGTTTELTNGLYQAFSAGAKDAEQALQITEDSARFAGAALTDTATAVDVLTTASNAYGAEVVTSTQAADIFFTTIKQGKITGEQLAGSIGQSIPLYASAGIELEELASGMAAMTKQGVAANESTTQLNAIVNSFLKPSEELSAALQEVGYASGGAFLEAEGLAGALELIEDQTGGSTDEIAKLLPNIRAMRGAMALTGEGGDIFAETMVEMADAAGANAEAFNKQEKTWATFRNTLDRTQIIVGNIGKAFVDELAVGATTAANSLNQFLMSGRAAEIFGAVIGNIAAGFETFQQYLQPITEQIMPAFQDIQAGVREEMEELGIKTGEGAVAFKVLGTMSQIGAASFRILSTGIIETIGNIAEMVDAIKATGGTIGKFFQFLGGKATWDEVKEQADVAGEAYKTFGQGVQASFRSVGETALEEFQGFGEAAEENAKTLETTYTTTAAAVGGEFESMYDRLITGQEDFNGQQVQLATIGGEDLEDTAGDTADEVVKTWSDAWSELKDGNAETWDAMMGNVQDFLSTFSQAWDATFGAAFDARDQFLQNQLDAEELAYERSLANLEAQRTAELLTDTEYEAQVAALEADHLKRTNELQKKQFENQKAASTAGVWIDAASSVAGWWASASALGFPAGPIIAGIMTAATLGMAVAQTAAISQQQFIPQFEKGGTTSGGGIQRINEAGGELVKLPDGSTVIPNDISREIAAASGGAVGTVVNVSFAGANISDNMDLDRIVEKVSRKLGRQMRAAS